MILFLIILFWAIGVILFSVYKIVLRGKEEYLILFVILYLPFYTTILSLVYLHTRSELLVNVFQYAKELMILVALLAFAFYKRDFFAYGFRLVFIDYLFITFLGLAFIFVLLPLGEAGIVEKGIYFKNMLLLGIMYFFGRNATLNEIKVTTVAHTILSIAVLAFVFNLFEYIIDTHFQSHTGYSLFQTSIRDREISGSYGLSWTFETSSGQKRFGSFLSDPLELASSVLMSIATGYIMLVQFFRSKGVLFYALGMFCSAGSLVMAFSRASFAALFLQIVFVGLLFGYYRIIFAGILMAFLVIIYFLSFAPPDTERFVYETVTFQESSSIGHLMEWLEGIQSMIDFPLGIGLAMSGNAGGVDDTIKVGGENQYIIFGVQMGIPGLLLYLSLLFFSIFYAVRAFKIANTPDERIIPFVAASTKGGLLLPLFTSNVESYLYIALVSWWMVGYSVAFYSRKNIR